jgi:hypothetical protein
VYDRDGLGAGQDREGIEMITSHYMNPYKKKMQDGGRIRRYKRQWVRKRFLDWIGLERRLRTERGYHAEYFLGLMGLADVPSTAESILRYAQS